MEFQIIDFFSQDLSFSQLNNDYETNDFLETSREQLLDLVDKFNDINDNNNYDS